MAEQQILNGFEPVIKKPKASNPPFISPKILPWQPKIPNSNYILRPSTGEINETSTDPGAIQTGYGSYKYAQVALHPTVTAGMHFLTQAPFWSGWTIQPQNDYTKFPKFEKIDKVIIALLESQIHNMKYDSFINVIKGIWEDCLVYGFSISEMNTAIREGYTVCNTIKTYSPYQFDFYLDEAWELQRLFYRPRGQFIDYGLLEKFCIVTYPRIIHGRHYGKSILQSIYFDVKIVEILEQAQAEGIRALAIKPLLLWFQGKEASEEDLQNIQNALYNIDSGALVSIPGVINPSTGEIMPSYKIEVMEDRGSPEGIALIKDVLTMLYLRINRQLFLPDDLGFSNTIIGSYAKAKEQMNLYMLTVETNQQFIQDFVNRQIIPFMIRYNYPELCGAMKYKLPAFKLGNVEEESTLTQVEYFEKLVAMGVINLNDPQDFDYVRNTLKLPEHLNNEEGLTAVPEIENNIPRKNA